LARHLPGMGSETIGDDSVLPWLSVLGAWICFGSFAVPMKWQSVVNAQVHPLIFQCYKTFWAFASAHLILFFQPYEFSYWGIVSGFSWVPAGIAAVIAVQHVGIACGQAVWQVTIIVTSMLWGCLVLHDEAVHSWCGTAASLLCLAMGIVGMTFSFNMKQPTLEAASNALIPPFGRSHSHGALCAKVAPLLPTSKSEGSCAELGEKKRTRIKTRKSLSDVRFSADDLLDCVDKSFDVGEVAASPRTSMALGISAALFNGVWGGANLVPSHYAPVHGTHFVISFGTGALIANVAIMFAYALVAKFWWRSALPSPHIRVMTLPGCLSGVLWSAGNFCSLYAVSTLGQGVGYSLIQSSVIVSGLWGIVYFRELRGSAVLCWSVFCALCVGGVLGLAAEKA